MVNHTDKININTRRRYKSWYEYDASTRYCVGWKKRRHRQSAPHAGMPAGSLWQARREAALWPPCRPLIAPATAAP